MDIHAVDPRTALWEDHAPVYRVYFWGTAMAASEYELVGASDAAEVLRWAEENRGDRTYTAYVVMRSGGDSGIARIYGTDPARRH